VAFSGGKLRKAQTNTPSVFASNKDGINANHQNFWIKIKRAVLAFFVAKAPSLTGSAHPMATVDATSMLHCMFLLENLW
jgi:hypothetical protein